MSSGRVLRFELSESQRAEISELARRRARTRDLAQRRSRARRSRTVAQLGAESNRPVVDLSDDRAMEQELRRVQREAQARVVAAAVTVVNPVAGNAADESVARRVSALVVKLPPSDAMPARVQVLLEEIGSARESFQQVLLEELADAVAGAIEEDRAGAAGEAVLDEAASLCEAWDLTELGRQIEQARQGPMPATEGDSLLRQVLTEVAARERCLEAERAADVLRGLWQKSRYHVYDGPHKEFYAVPARGNLGVRVRVIGSLVETTQVRISDRPGQPTYREAEALCSAAVSAEHDMRGQGVKAVVMRLDPPDPSPLVSFRPPHRGDEAEPVVNKTMERGQ